MIQPITKYQCICDNCGDILTSPTMLVEIKGIRIGRGNPERGAPTDRDVFILDLGKIIEP